MFSIKSHCPNCFGEGAAEPKCARCGFDPRKAVGGSNYLSPFTRLASGPYWVGCILGRPGGFGVVYAGWHEGLHRKVAIKEFFPSGAGFTERDQNQITVRPTYGGEQIFGRWLRRFFREAKLLAQFDNHSRIVPVRDIFETNGTAYLVMDRLEGQTLSQYLGLYVGPDQVLRARHPLTTAAAMTLLQALLEALEVLHEASPEPVYHRDITPNNLFLENDHLNRLRLLDFGLAQRGERQPMSSTSIGVGTPSYAAPEQVQTDSSTSIGPHTDLYALGSVLYTALSGRAPPPVISRLAGVSTTPIKAWVPGLSPPLAEVIDACLQLEATRRPQNVQAIRCQLAMTILLPADARPMALPDAMPEAIPDTLLEPESQPKPRGLSFSRIGLASGLLAGLIAIAAWQYNNTTKLALVTPAPEDNTKTDEMQEQPLAKPDLFPYLPDLNTEKIKALQLAAANKAGKSVIFRDTLSDGSQGPEMVVIPAGEFMMGSVKGEDLHRVRIEPSFALAKYTVTFEEYERFTQAKGLNKPNDQAWGRGQRPVIHVNWQDAVAYAQWLSQETGQNYRLPTEAEWEYAARAGTQTIYYWGEDPNIACKYANVHDVSSTRANKFNWTHHACEDGFSQTAPVGQFKPNRFGFYDMLGNVWEWSCSEYRDEYNGQEQECMDKTDASRIVRGGSWGNEPSMLRASHRVQLAPTTRNNGVGFRLVREL